LTQEQLYATADYQQKSLQGVRLAGNDLSGWDFSGQDLTVAGLSGSNLNGANLIGANLRNANLWSSLEAALVDSTTVYSQGTQFPPEFDPVAAGLTFMPTAAGDFDANDLLDENDLYLLVERIWYEKDDDLDVQFGWLPEAMFDLNASGGFDQGDHFIWVKDLRKTWLGDANLDGEFNSSDLVQVFVAGRYEEVGKDVNDPDFEYEGRRITTWAEGDWDGDGFFKSSDLVAALADRGYEQGPWTEPLAVPEPATWLLLAMGLSPLLFGEWIRRPV
jgi:uncharacterized protein YjbI with pentapeptide repeats